jgi:hypothetical protein
MELDARVIDGADGASGSPNVVTADDSSLCEPVPTPFTALILSTYVVLWESPVKVYAFNVPFTKKKAS